MADIDPRILDEVIAVIESGNNPKAINPKSGALGKYQILPSTLRDLQKRKGVMPGYAPSGSVRIPEQSLEQQFLQNPDLQKEVAQSYLPDFAGGPTDPYSMSLRWHEGPNADAVAIAQKLARDAELQSHAKRTKELLAKQGAPVSDRVPSQMASPIPALSEPGADGSDDDVATQYAKYLQGLGTAAEGRAAAERAVPADQDLMGLAMFSDQFAGSNFAKNYKAPTKQKEALDRATEQDALAVAAARELAGNETAVGRGMTSAQQQNLDLRKQNQKSGAIFKVQRAFEADIKDQKSRALAAKTVKSLVTQGGPVALKALQPQLARLAGHTGNIAVWEQRGLGGSQAVDAAIDRWLTAKTVGEFTERDRADILKIADVFEKENTKEISRRAQKAAKQGAGAYGHIGMTEKEFADALALEAIVGDEVDFMSEDELNAELGIE